MNLYSPDASPSNPVNYNSTGWVNTNQARKGVRFLDRRRGPFRDMAADTRRRRLNGSGGMFPFRVYPAQLAFDYQTFSDIYTDPTTWWRIFLVRGGRVWDKVLYGGGSDGYDTDPHSDFFSSTNDQGHSVSPIVVPEDSDPYYLWIEMLVDGQPQLRQGVDPSDDPDSVIQWRKWPEMDGIHFAIAEIDTITTPYEATVRQIANCDFIYKFREVKDCVKIDGVDTQVYRQAVVSDWYLDPVGNTDHIVTDDGDDDP